MSDEFLPLKTLQPLSEDGKIVDIRRQVEFIAAVKEGRRQIRYGEAVSLDEVEKKIRKWAGR